jgi:hypothetical protein
MKPAQARNYSANGDENLCRKSIQQTKSNNTNV